MSIQVDHQAKANIDRLDRLKMNSLRRVSRLPSRGGLGDWVIVSETRKQNGEDVKVDVTYAWMEDKWTAIGTPGDQSDAEIQYSGEFS